jgi:O-antigen/teichoic acid export membrane protein
MQTGNNMPHLTLLKQRIRKTTTQLRQSPLVKNFFIYSCGSLLLRGISLFLAPITMHILAPQDYGIIALANSFVSILTVFIGLGLRQAFSIEYFHCNTKQRKIMINNIILIYLIFSTPLIIFFSFFPSLINKFVFVGNAPNTLIFLSLAYSFLYFFVEFFYQQLTYRAQALKMTLIQISVALTIIGCNILFLCWLKWGVLSLMTGQVIGLVIVCIIALKSYLQKACHIYINIQKCTRTCGNYLKLGLPFIPGMLCGWIFSSSDRLILAQYGSMRDVGIYSIASVFGQLFQMLILFPTSRAYIPAVLKKFSENKNNLLSVEQWNRRNMVLSMTGLVILISVGYLMCKPILQIILPARYQPAIEYIWMILMGYIFLLGEYFASIFVIFNKKATFQATSLIVPSIVNVLLNILLIPYLNITGCVIATVISSMIYFGIKLGYNLYLQKKLA